MLNFSTTINVLGDLPSPLKLDDVLDRHRLELRAQTIYDTDPNLVAQVLTDEGPIVIKHFGWRHPIHRLLSPTFPSRAEASWIMAHALTDAHALTPKPVYMYTKRRRGVIHENIFITMAIHPHKTLRNVLKSDVKFTFLQTAINSLATSLARMHNAGIFHHDLTTGNFLVSETGDVFIIDLNRAKLLKNLSPHHRLTDLSKLNFKTINETTIPLLEGIFFNTYKKESKMDFDWLGGYHEYRKYLLTRKQRKKRLHSLIR